jgi:predicted ATPase
MNEGYFRLQSLRVQGYKILKDFVLDSIGPLTVIVGPNGCGKTALWEVITLFPDLMKVHPSLDIDTYMYQLFYPHRSHMGFQGVVHPQTPASGVAIELEFMLRDQSYTYKLCFASASPWQLPRLDIVFEKLTSQEKVLLCYEGRRDYETLSPQGVAPKKYQAFVNKQEIEVSWPHFYPLLVLDAPNDELAKDELFRKMRQYFKSWRGFKPAFIHLLAKGGQNLDAHLITPGERFPGEWLDVPMGNLPQVLFRLKEQNRDRFEEIEEIFLVAIDSPYDTLSVYQESYQIKVFLGRANKPNELWLADWPDGWKAFLSWLVALRTAPPGAVIYLEEPENNLHPRLLAQLLEQIRLANQRGIQVFISTHSMELVNSIEPHELVLMENGQAYRVDGEKARHIQEAGILLGSAWVEGILEDIAKPPAATSQ